jgi:hypothetical protein
MGQCREIGVDARTWQPHLLRELRRITGCKMAGIVQTVPTPRGLASKLATGLKRGRESFPTFVYNPASKENC